MSVIESQQQGTGGFHLFRDRVAGLGQVMTMVDENGLINSVAAKGHRGTPAKAQWPALRTALIDAYKEVGIDSGAGPGN